MDRAVHTATFRALGLCGVVILVISSNALGADIASTWTGAGGSTNWNNPLNWDPNSTYPNNGTNTYDVRINNNPAAAVTVNVNGAYAIRNLAIDSDDRLKIDNGMRLTISQGTVRNGGAIVVGFVDTDTFLLVDGNVCLTGGGTVVLSNWAAITGVNATGTHRLVIDSNCTIQGSGNIGYYDWSITGNLALTNRGTIDANYTAIPLTVEPKDLPAVNSGTMQASAGGTLLLTNGTFTNTGGTVRALTGSTVTLEKVTFIGGTLTNAGTGLLQVNTSTLQDVANTGRIYIRNAVLRGTIQDAGQISLGPSGWETTIDGNVVFTGPGTVLMTISRIKGASASGNDHLLNDANHAIIGSGQLGGDSMTLTNLGLIEANHPQALEVSPSSFGATNAGTMQASAGGTLALRDGTFANDGGTISARNLSLVQLDGVTITGGLLSTAGSGLIRVIGAGATFHDVTTSGLLRTVLAAQLSVGGNWFQSAGQTTSDGWLVLTDGNMVLLGGSATINGPQYHTRGNMEVRGGSTATIKTDAGSATRFELQVTVREPNSSVSFAATQHLAGLCLAAGGKAQVASAGNRVLVTRDLSIDANSSALDLVNNDMVVDYEPGGSAFADVSAWIAAGFNGGDWLGKGITSTATADPNYGGLAGIGFADNAEGLTGEFSGQTVDDTSVLVKFTWYGDADLNGAVNTDDFGLWVAGFSGDPGTSPTWLYGDFDYNGAVNTDDFALWAYAFDGQTTVLSEGFGAAVPEPATLILLGAGALGWVRRRGIQR